MRPAAAPGFFGVSLESGGRRPSVAILGVLVALGVISFVAVLGVVFPTVLETPLTAVVEVDDSLG